MRAIKLTFSGSDHGPIFIGWGFVCWGVASSAMTIVSKKEEVDGLLLEDVSLMVGREEVRVS